MNIPELIKEAHDNAIKRGFYDCIECGRSGYDENTLIAIPDKPHPKCHTCNGSKINPNKNIGELLMLIVSELGEALEAHRCNYYGDWDTYENDYEISLDDYTKPVPEKIKLKLQNKYFEMYVKDNFEDEIADTFIRLFDLCGYLEIDIEKHIRAKMAYNRTRPHKHDKEY